MLCLFLCAAMFVGLFVPLVPPLGVCVCSTSPPGGNQVDGLPPAPVIRELLQLVGQIEGSATIDAF